MIEPQEPSSGKRHFSAASRSLRYRGASRLPMTSRLLLALTGALCLSLQLALVPRLARAQDNENLELARQRFREGVTFYDQRNYEKARIAFLQAYAIKPHPSVLLNLAQSELRANRPADAAGHFAEFIRDNPDVGDAEKQEAELGFAAARSKVAEVVVECDIEGATVSVDGEERGTTPLDGPVYLAPGGHEITAVSGTLSGSRVVTAVAGRNITTTLRLEPESAPADAVGAGDMDGSSDATGTITADDFTVSSHERQPFFEWFASQPVAWFTTGVTGVALVAGTAFALGAKSDFDEANNIASEIRFQAEKRGYTPDRGECTPQGIDFLDTSEGVFAKACQTYEDRTDSAQSQKTAATVSFIVAGLSAVGTAVFYIVDSSPDENAAKGTTPRRTAIVPIATPKVQGLAITGSF